MNLIQRTYGMTSASTLESEEPVEEEPLFVDDEIDPISILLEQERLSTEVDQILNGDSEYQYSTPPGFDDDT